jgi:hypothetical protein
VFLLKRRFNGMLSVVGTAGLPLIMAAYEWAYVKCY